MFSKKTGFTGTRLTEEMQVALSDLVAVSGQAESVILRCALHDFFKGKFQKRKEIIRLIERRKRLGDFSRHRISEI